MYNYDFISIIKAITLNTRHFESQDDWFEVFSKPRNGNRTHMASQPLPYQLADLQSIESSLV